MIKVIRINDAFYQVKRGRLIIKKFFGANAKERAHDFAQELVEDNNWNMSNR